MLLLITVSGCYLQCSQAGTAGALARGPKAYAQKTGLQNNEIHRISHQAPARSAALHGEFLFSARETQGALKPKFSACVNPKPKAQTNLWILSLQENCDSSSQYGRNEGKRDRRGQACRHPPGPFSGHPDLPGGR